MTSSQKICTFYLENLFFGLVAERVQETSRNHKITPVPLAPPIISGVINLRGRISTAINLNEIFMLDTDKDKKNKIANIVIQTENNELLNLLVDRVDDIMEIAEDKFECSPETLSDEIRELIYGTYKLENKILLLINHKALFDRISSITKLKNKKDVIH